MDKLSRRRPSRTPPIATKKGGKNTIASMTKSIVRDDNLVSTLQTFQRI